jgi:cAMP phosphodiesterase
MDLRTLGCHGGESPKHRNSAFLLNGRVAIDAGAITSMLTLREQQKIEAVIVSHGHLDHVRDLAILADARAQQGGPPLTIVSTAGTIRSLKKHYFNDKLWPDFSTIPLSRPTVIFKIVRPGNTAEVFGFTVKPVLVDHPVEASGYVISQGQSAIAYSGDTGPTEHLWEVLRAERNLKALIMEVAFPNEQQALALRAGHHTPQMLEKSLAKLGRRRDLPVLLFHIKPVFERTVMRELARIKRRNLEVLRLGDSFSL